MSKNVQLSHLVTLLFQATKPKRKEKNSPENSSMTFISMWHGSTLHISFYLNEYEKNGQMLPFVSSDLVTLFILLNHATFHRSWGKISHTSHRKHAHCLFACFVWIFGWIVNMVIDLFPFVYGKHITYLHACKRCIFVFSPQQWENVFVCDASFNLQCYKWKKRNW